MSLRMCALIVHHHQSLGEFENGVMSYVFAHIEGGVRHIAIYEDRYAFEMHAINTFNAPMLDRGATFAEYTTARSVMMGLPEDLQKSNYVASMLPGDEYINDTPDSYSWGPLLHGLLNEPYDAEVGVDGPIVINWFFRFKPSKEKVAKDILHQTI